MLTINKQSPDIESGINVGNDDFDVGADDTSKIHSCDCGSRCAGSSRGCTVRRQRMFLKSWTRSVSINNMDLPRDEEGCHEADQAGCGRTDHGETQQLQARLDEITTKRDGIKKDVSDRDTRMKRGGLCQRS